MTTDTGKEILLEAVQKTAAAYQVDASVENLKKWKAARAALEEYQRDAQASAAGQRFKNLSAAHEWLLSQGYKVSDRTLRNHKKAHLFPEQPGGGFMQKDLEAYAQTHLERPGYREGGEEKQSAKDRFLEAQAEEKSLKVKQLRGELIDAAEEEARDAALWRAVRSDIEQQAPQVINRLVELVLAFDLTDDARRRLTASLPGLRELYIDEIADIFDRFAKDGGVFVEE